MGAPIASVGFFGMEKHRSCYLQGMCIHPVDTLTMSCLEFPTCRGSMLSACRAAEPLLSDASAASLFAWKLHQLTQTNRSPHDEYMLQHGLIVLKHESTKCLDQG